MNTEDEYLSIIQNTQIVSIDLIIYNEKGHVLLGKRKNKPAQNMYFTPGGRVFKLEQFQDAISRISKNEVGSELSNGKLHGVYHHIYPQNFKNDLFSTHYINFAYAFDKDTNVNTSNLKNTHGNDQYTDQHHDFKWFSISDLLTSTEVHENVQKYFQDHPANQIV